MKTKLLIALFCVFSVNTQAQFFKKLKDKISQKVDNVVDQKIDKILTDTSKETVTPQNTTTNANGVCTIKHNNSIGNINLNNFRNVKTTASNHQLKINGSWLTHDVDIADGIYITVHDPDFISENVTTLNSKTYTLYKSEDVIPSKGAVISIAYDPNKTNSTPSKNYQNYYLTNGTLTLKNITDTNVEITFKGTPLDPYHSIQNLASSVSGNLSVNNTTTTYNFEQQQEEHNDNGYNNSSANIKNYDLTKAKSVEKTYVFDNTITYNYSDGNNNYQYLLLQNQQENYFATSMDSHEGNVVYIQDGDKGVSLIEANGEKMQIPSQHNINDKIEHSFGTIGNNNSFKKTGKTKTILGYKAHQYSVKDDQGNITEIWASDEVNLKNIMIGNNPIIKGFIMEITYKQNDDVLTSKITKISKETTIFNTIEYKNLLNISY
ncbi:hypothetical protein Q4595_14570 [Wenyingzhuangia sp. 1_MG-2023]|nr:hypothetical protein [Wenyingzhuangia sp. 1_MG-2023]